MEHVNTLMSKGCSSKKMGMLKVEGFYKLLFKCDKIITAGVSPRRPYAISSDPRTTLFSKITIGPPVATSLSTIMAAKMSY